MHYALCKTKLKVNLACLIYLFVLVIELKVQLRCLHYTMSIINTSSDGHRLSPLLPLVVRDYKWWWQWRWTVISFTVSFIFVAAPREIVISHINIYEPKHALSPAREVHVSSISSALVHAKLAFWLLTLNQGIYLDRDPQTVKRRSPQC